MACRGGGQQPIHQAVTEAVNTSDPWRRRWRPGAPAAALLVSLTVTAALALGLRGLWRPGGSGPGMAQDRTAPARTATRLLMDPATRLAEARRLGDVRDATAVPLLRKFTDDPDPQVRAACVKSLGQIGEADSVQAVLNRVVDREPAVRIEAARALVLLYGDRADGGLRDLIKDEEAQVRRAAAEAMASLQDDRAAAHLTRALDDSDPQVRLAAVTSLAAMRHDAALSGLAKGLVHADAAVRQAAAEAVKGRSSQVAGLLRTQVSASSTVAARLQTARLLGQMGDPSAVPALLALLENFGRQTPAGVDELKVAVVEALAQLGEPAVAPLVAETLHGEREPLAEQAAADALVRIGAPAVGPITEGIRRWKVFTDQRELTMWLESLRQLGAPMQEVPEDRLLAGRPGAAATRPLQRGVVVLTPPSPGASELPDNGVVRLVLEKVMLAPGAGADRSRLDLDVELIRRGGRWQPSFWAYCIDYNKREHPGRLSLPATDDALETEILFLDDRYIEGGYGQFSIKLQGTGGQVAGRYGGHFNFHPVSGGVSVKSWALPENLAMPRPVEPGEHPRLLFRKGDIPILREKVRTDFGQRVIGAIRQRLAADKLQYQRPVNWVTTWQSGPDLAIGHGLLYALFDDVEHGRRAAALVMERTRTPPYGGEHGERLPFPLMHYPFAYDLAYNCMTEAERGTVAKALISHNGFLTPAWGLIGALSGGRPPGVYGVPGLAALALLHEPGEFDLPEPTSPMAVLELAAEGQRPVQGVPVNELKPGAILRQWLVTGPFDDEKDEDPLAGIGGPENARPTEGSALPYRGATFRFVRIADDAVRPVPGVARDVDCLSIDGATAESTSYLYCQIVVARDTGCVVGGNFVLGARWGDIWINGQRIDPPTAVLLKAGVHRVMMRVVGPVACPVFDPADALVAKARWKQYEWLKARWLSAKETHGRTGASPRVEQFFEACRLGMRQSLWHQQLRAAGGGAATGGNTQWPFVHACWVATGEALVPDTPMPLASFAPAAWRDVSDGQLIFTMGMAPGKLKSQLAREFARRHLPDGLARLSCLQLVAAFVNYPLERIEP